MILAFLIVELVRAELSKPPPWPVLIEKHTLVTSEG